MKYSGALIELRFEGGDGVRELFQLTVFIINDSIIFSFLPTDLCPNLQRKYVF